MKNNTNKLDKYFTVSLVLLIILVIAINVIVNFF